MHVSSRTSRQKGLCPPAAGAHRKALNWSAPEHVNASSIHLGRGVAYPDRTAFVGDYFRIAGHTSGTIPRPQTTFEKPTSRVFYDCLMPVDLGFRQYGYGSVRAIVLHYWFCDHSNWDAMTPYLTPDQFTYAFADLRGYGDSRNLSGEYTLGEAASDVIALADRLG